MMSIPCVSVRQIFLLVLILLAMAVMSDAQHGQQLTKRDSSKRFCGPVLTGTLKLLCQNGYYEMEKKSDDDEYYADQPQMTDDNQLQMQEFPFISRMVASEKKRAFRRFRRGAVDECCRQPCTFAELRSYCKPM